MSTPYLIIRPGSEKATLHSIEWPHEPGFHRIGALVCPLLGEREPLEHVTVLYSDKRCDMFVSEYGQMPLTWRPPLPRNDRATAIYRRASMRANPEQIEDDLPTIAGVAVLFLKRVWF